MARRVVANNCMSANEILDLIIQALGRKIFVGPQKLCAANDAARCRRSKKHLFCARCAKFEIIVRKIDEKR